MRNLLSLLLVGALMFTSCSKDDDGPANEPIPQGCRCQAATDLTVNGQTWYVWIEKACNQVTDADLNAVLEYAGQNGASYVYTDTAQTICN